MKRWITLTVALLVGLIYASAFGETVKIRALGDSTSTGRYDGIDHLNDLDACIPLMIEQSVIDAGLSCSMDNQAVRSTTVDWHLGIKDGDEGEYEPDLVAEPPGAPFFLAKSKAIIVTIQLGINDAVYVDPSEFEDDFTDLIRYCKRTGKKIFITMPNSIGEDNDKLIVVAGILEDIGDAFDVEVVNSGVQDVSMNDTYHPTPAGYQDLASDLEIAVSDEAENALFHCFAARYYVCMYNKPGEKGGVDYWANELKTKTENVVAQTFIDCVEFFEGTMTDTQFVTRLYINSLNRSPDPGGLAYWLGRLAVVPKGVVMNEFIGCIKDSTNTDGRYFQNKVSVGYAYGYIYGNTTVLAPGILNTLNVDSNYSSVYPATINF